MFRPKLNSLLTGVLVATLAIAVGGSVMAQDGLRLWKPYTADSFGGGRRGNDGVYGSLSAIYWSISTPTGGYVGATNSKGDDDTRWVYDGGKVFAQTNSVKINMMSPTTTLGTRFEVGNRRGHHGWLVSGYGLPTQSHRMNVQNISMTIRDEGNLTYQSVNSNNPTYGVTSSAWYIWDRNNNALHDPTAPSNSAHYPYADWQFIDGTTPPANISGIGYLWGVFEGFSTDGSHVGVFAPLPICFGDVNISVRTSHLSAELMYTYRAHPFTWGGMELLAGAKYWEFEDEFGFYGTGRAHETGEGGTMLTGPVSVLADMTVNASGMNRIFGPQVGMKLSRHNARWTFGAEGRLTGGINVQTAKTQGNIGTNYDVYRDNFIGDPGAVHGMIMPIGLRHSNNNFGHKKDTAIFSPIVDFRLTADWQWTNAVSFFGAVDAMWAGNIARGVRVTDYVVHSDGTIFGIRGNDRNTHVGVYGVEAGIKVRR